MGSYPYREYSRVVLVVTSSLVINVIKELYDNQCATHNIRKIIDLLYLNVLVGGWDAFPPRSLILVCCNASSYTKTHVHTYTHVSLMTNNILGSLHMSVIITIRTATADNKNKD